MLDSLFLDISECYGCKFSAVEALFIHPLTERQGLADSCSPAFLDTVELRMIF